MSKHAWKDEAIAMKLAGDQAPQQCASVPIIEDAGGGV